MTSTKYSIKYQLNYFNADGKFKREQVSLDKSKSLQYNLRKWINWLKLPSLTSDLLDEPSAVFLWRVSDDTAKQILNKDFSQEELLFLG